MPSPRCRPPVPAVCDELQIFTRYCLQECAGLCKNVNVCVIFGSVMFMLVAGVGKLPQEQGLVRAFPAKLPALLSD